MNNEEKAQAYFEMYSNLTYDDSNIKHKVLVSDMAQFISNNNDNLGLQSISLNGISEAYLTQFPPYILNAISSIKERVKFF